MEPVINLLLVILLVLLTIQYVICFARIGGKEYKNKKELILYLIPLGIYYKWLRNGINYYKSLDNE
jgi:hypothetical protein